MKPSADDPRPTYVQVADALRNEIQGGSLKVGQRLPSLKALSERFAIAPMTTQNALRVLRNEGLIVAAPGRGYFVKDPDAVNVDTAPGLQHQIDRLSSQLEHLAQRVAKLEQQSPSCASD